MTKEHMWKTVLSWAAVLLFFALPITVFTLHMYALTHPGWVGPPIEGDKYDFAYLQNLQRDITFLVFGLAGLRTWEVLKNGRNNNHEAKTTNNDR